MRKLIGCITMLLATSAVKAQNVGIGTTDPQNRLHIAGGLRVDTLAGTTAGLLQHGTNGAVYSLPYTGNVSQVLRGNGTFGTLNTWNTTGNAGTSSATNFLGTTDDQPLRFRINNTLAGQITRSSANVALGYETLVSNTGTNNVAMGLRSLFSNTTGSHNTAIGTLSQIFNTTGDNNTAVGFATMFSNTSGGNNVAIGYQALYSNTTAGANIAIGRSALYNNRIGIDNVAVGLGALMSNTENYNTAIGTMALVNNTSGSGNVAIGRNAMQTNTTGYNLTAIGNGANVSANNLFNATAIGAGTIVDASNKVVIGNSAVTQIGGSTTWSQYSDGRFKNDIREDVPGLAFIKQLRPVTYVINRGALDTHLNKQVGDIHQVVAIESLPRETGFIAQEVEMAAQELNYTFSGVKTPKSQKDVYSLGYSEFVVPLVKAVQEQQLIIEKQQQQIDMLIKELQKIREKLK